jgi:hypothetical protein
MVPMGFHEARHTYISWLVASGLNIHSGHERRSVDRLNAFAIDRLEPNL